MTRHRPARRALAALLAVALVGCGSSPADDGAAETWPMRVDLPGLLGYAAVDVRPGELDRLFGELAGIELDGLADDGRLVILHLDETTHGGGQSVAIPIDDPAAVNAFLDAPDSGVERLDEQRVRVTIDSGSDFAQLVRMVENAAAAPQGGVATVMSMLGGRRPLVVTLQVAVDDEHLLLAPSFEGVAVTRGLLKRVPALSASGEVDELVAVWDVERIGLAYHDQIQAARSQVRMLFSTAPAAGFGAVMMGMQGRGDGPELPRISADVLDAFLKMADGLAVDGLRIEAVRGAASLPDLAEDDFFASPLRASLDVPDGALLTTLRPAPDLPDAAWVLGADADEFARVAAAWCKPLAEVKHGRGQVADDAVAELEALLAGWGGALAGGVDDAIVLSTNPATGLDLDGLVAWFAPIADRVGDGDVASLERGDDDTWRLVDSDGASVARIGRVGDDALWVSADDRVAPPLTGIEALLRARAPEGGPVQRIAFDEDGTSVIAEFFGRGDVVDLELAWSP